MGMMIVRHKVRDYGQWRPVFDQHAQMQRAAGLLSSSIPRILRKAKEFAASPDLKEAMMTAGVLDTPTIYFLESID